MANTAEGSPPQARRRETARGVYEERHWKPDFGRSRGKREGAGTYEAFIPNPIAQEDPTLASSTSALTERAGNTVRELNASEPRLMPLEGLARQLLRSEALASSRIEGLNLSHRKLAQAAIEGQGEYKALEVLGNMRALEEAVRIGSAPDQLTPKDLLAIHRELAIVPPLDRIAGQFRTGQGWIGGATPLDAEYVPPPHDHVPGLVGDLCEFMNRDDLSPVAQAAIAHAQFELIHPFGDGNGRVGRALIHALLRRRGLAPRYVPPVSLVLGANRDAYIAGLGNFRANRVDDWVAQFARAVETASAKAEEFSAQVSELQEDWLKRAGRLRQHATARRIIEELPAFPFITTAIVQELTQRSDVAALNGLRQLEEASILTRHRNKRKGDSWEAKELFTLLSRYEESVRGR